ncbi:MAG: serine hydrolase domain-containing protein [Ilumatobacteraceae bacterium]
MHRGIARLSAVSMVVASAVALGVLGGPAGSSVSGSGSSAGAVRAQTAPPTGWPVQPAGVPFPTDEWATGPLPAGVDQAVIDDAVEVAFGAPDATGRVQSVVVVEGGRIVYERYHPLDGPAKVYDWFSVAKSVTSALIGLLVADGLLELDEPPDVEQWQTPGDPRQAITLRQLLQMSSGLEWSEVYAPESIVVEAITAPNSADFVAELPLEAEPGTQFEYSTGTTILLAGIAADALGGCQAQEDYLNARLFDVIGITSDTLLRDASGCWFGGLGANMTTRDFARFGLLYLRGGFWDGATVLPVEWVEESREPAPTNPGYGLQWWIESPEIFTARGLFGQLIYVVPGQDLVIAVNSTGGGANPSRLVQAVLATFGIGEPPEPELPPSL